MAVGIRKLMRAWILPGEQVSFQGGFRRERDPEVSEDGASSLARRV